jgi:hypothetical protein
MIAVEQSAKFAYPQYRIDKRDDINRWVNNGAREDLGCRYCATSKAVVHRIWVYARRWTTAVRKGSRDV